MEIEVRVSRNIVKDFLSNFGKAFGGKSLEEAAQSGAKYAKSEIDRSLNRFVYGAYQSQWRSSKFAKKRSRYPVHLNGAYLAGWTKTGRSSKFFITNFAAGPSGYRYAGSVEAGQGPGNFVEYRSLASTVAQVLGTATSLNGLKEIKAFNSTNKERYGFGNMPARPITTASLWVTRNWLISQRLPTLASATWKSQITGRQTERFLFNGRRGGG